MEEAQANRRSSSRLVEGGPRAPPVRYSEEYAALEEAEQLMRLPSRKRGRTGGGSGGRGKRTEEAETLSEEERAALAGAYAEAEGWLNSMRRFFTDKLSEANLRNVMKQV